MSQNKEQQAEQEATRFTKRSMLKVRYNPNILRETSWNNLRHRVPMEEDTGMGFPGLSRYEKKLESLRVIEIENQMYVGSLISNRFEMTSLTN